MRSRLRWTLKGVSGQLRHKQKAPLDWGQCLIIFYAVLLERLVDEGYLVSDAVSLLGAKVRDEHLEAHVKAVLDEFNRDTQSRYTLKDAS